MGNCGLIVKVDNFDNILSGIGISASPKARRIEKRRLTQNVVKENVGDIEEFYDIHEQMILGSGMNGSVVQCVHKATRTSYALKRITKRDIETHRLDQIRDELNCMSLLDHPNILRIHEVFEDEERICLVLELCRGGHLMDRLMNQRGRFYREQMACKYIHSILTAVAYCHANNVVHRDLKLENILFETEARDSELKIIDFGLSRWFTPNKMMHSRCGTSEYVAPEVLDGKYDAKCDVWSVGVIAFMLLTGSAPFNGATDAELFASIRAAQWRFEDHLLNKVSPEAKDFITKCLTKRVAKRFCAADALKHRWFTTLKTHTAEVPPSPILLQRFHAFIVRTWLAKIFIDVLSHTLPPTSIVELRAQFNRFDLSGSGQISIEDLRCITRGYARGIGMQYGQFTPGNSASNSPVKPMKSNTSNSNGSGSPMKPAASINTNTSTINNSTNTINSDNANTSTIFTYNATYNVKGTDGDNSAASSMTSCTSENNNTTNNINDSSNTSTVDQQEEFLNAVFRNMDIDQTGKISYHEFLAATINRKHFTEQNLRLAFEVISHNREYITSGDVVSILGSTQYDIEGIMQEVGLSSDSRIDFDTFKSILNGHDDDLNSFLNKYEDL